MQWWLWVKSMRFQRSFLAAVFASLSVFWGNAALAETEIKFYNETPAFRSRILEAGPVEVSVTYEPYKAGQDYPEAYKNLRYDIAYGGIKQISSGDLMLFTGGVSLKDLDGDRTAEVIIETYSGGAHCCTNFRIYSWRNDRFRETETGMLDGSGGTFRDIEGDGKMEFLTADNRFLYTFSSYAGSYPPSRILSFRRSKFEDVTRRYPKTLRTRLQRMFNAFQDIKRHNGTEVNGILAGYVAQKILLGEYEAGWKFMLANYDRQSDWGLEIYRGSQPVGRHPNFPTALRAFLIEAGYLDKQGNPVK